MDRGKERGKGTKLCRVIVKMLVRKGGDLLLGKILESKLGPMTNAQFSEVMDLATTDIQTNRLGFGKRTSLAEAVEIAKKCFIALGRGKVV